MFRISDIVESLSTRMVQTGQLSSAAPRHAWQVVPAHRLPPLGVDDDLPILFDEAWHVITTFAVRDIA